MLRNLRTFFEPENWLVDLNQLFPSLPQPGREHGTDYSNGNGTKKEPTTKKESTTKKEPTTKKEDEGKQGDSGSGARTMNIPNFCLLIGGIFIFLKVNKF